jgi:hypothetical protein
MFCSFTAIEPEMEDSGLPQPSNLSRETEEFADHARETMAELGTVLKMVHLMNTML